MPLLLMTILTLGLLAITVTADAGLDTRIDALISAVNDSNCQFIRNGKIYTPMESVAHIRKKYNYFKDDIDSIDTFIEFSATKSMMSGKPYKIKCEGSGTELSSSWMSNKAVEIGIIQ